MTPASRSTLAENVAAAVRQSIENGDYGCGDRLVELSLAHEMNVSQNTVRDALRLLEQEGLLVKNPRRGTYVRSFSRDEALELFTLRASIESLAMRWAAERIQSEDLDRLVELLADARVSAQEGSSREATTILARFHEVIWDVANRPQTSELLRTLRNRTILLENTRYRRRPRTTQEQLSRIDAHEMLIKALHTGSSDTAQHVMTEHVMDEYESLLPVITDLPE